MEILDTINSKLKEAMKAKDEDALDALRSIKSALDYKKAESGGDVADDATVLQIIRKEAKKRKDSITQFKDGGRDDLVGREEAQLKIIESFLPGEMSAEQIEAKVKEAITELGATSRKEMGKVMGKVMADLKGKVDGNRVKQIVSDLLE